MPDANADASANDMAYYFGGFLFLQDIVDRSVIGAVANSASESVLFDPFTYLGVYMQEFPYPCYSYDE